MVAQPPAAATASDCEIFAKHPVGLISLAAAPASDCEVFAELPCRVAQGTDFARGSHKYTCSRYCHF